MRKWSILILTSIVLVVGGGTGFWFLTHQSAQKVVHIITFVSHPVLNEIETSFREKFDEILGAESESVRVITSSANGRIEILPELSRLALLNRPEIILTISTPVTQALMREADDRQKIVFTFVTNPSTLGDELTRTNSTGLSDAVNYGANLDLLRAVFGPDVTIGMLYNPNEANSQLGITAMQDLIKGSATKLLTSAVTQEIDIPTVAAQLAGSVEVIYVGGDNTVVGAIPVLLQVAREKGVPVFASDAGSIQAGAAAGISVNYKELGFQTAEMIGRVLHGEEPRKIPRVVLPGNLLLVNREAVKEWSIQLPESVMTRATYIEE